MTTMNVIIKAHLQRADSTLEVRRIPVSVPNQDHNGIFNEIAAKVGNAFPGLFGKRFTLKWKDCDGDFVMMSTDEEMLEAISNAQNSPLKIFITVDGVKETEASEVIDMQSEKGEEPVQGGSNADECQKDEVGEGGWTFLDFMGMPFRPPGFGLFENPHCRKAGGSRKRCHPDFFNPRHFGPLGHHFGHHGPHGPHGHHHGPFGPHGHHMGMFGPFECHRAFEGPFTHFGHHFKHHFGHHHPHHHGKRHHGKDGWKATLREAVPVAHRRWAKAFIRNWRVENLQNATSTSSDSDQDIYDMNTAGVPDAYAMWLQTLLPKWHRRQGQETTDDGKKKEKNEEDKDKLKASVPMEFRKWTKWYLARHFGKKDSPKFCKHAGGHHFEKKMEKHGRDWKKAYKMHTLGVSIPVMHRMWAKIFIRDWRQEHNIPDPRAGPRGTVSSESEDTERETSKKDLSVPNDYIRWMRKFLARWHLWRGEVQNVEIEKGGMGEFKDTVPWNFRKWVKCFLWRRYGSGASREADTTSQYQKWLQAFQKKWLTEKDRGDSTDEIVLTSSDEAEKTVESSLKKLRLEGEDNGTKKNVQFHPSTDAASTAEGSRMVDSDIGEFENAVFHKKMNGSFRNWAKAALRQWDGNTVQTEGASANEPIPPHIYNWMSKMMMKIQSKRMKLELKEARDMLRAARKAQK